MSTPDWSFIFHERYPTKIAGRGLVYHVQAPFEYDRKDPPFRGTIVRINNIIVKCTAVEQYAKMGPVKIGEEIGIVVPFPPE